ncbi:glycosyltransferase family 2 protein [Vibrio hannami]|uniref:glycosyltransferase family 2 protein n=1 Tax=Vibrio hannami TaxID=2717094 RepID=UPI00240F1439|nr:glycosyltransferase family 2 protein [Vibrio hannami]MDG3086940.1 glycosyltransferase family 2 protein [Vibrio hannami]
MSITSIIVTFQPELSSVEQLLTACQSHGNNVIVVDNGSENAEELAEVCQSFEYVNFIRLGDNLGIATAQNIAIKQLRTDKDDLIVFFDQDSSIGSDYLMAVEQTYQKLENEFGREVIIGPRFYNRVSQFEYPVIKLNKLGRRRKLYPSQFTHPIEASCIISSGMAVKKKILDQVGLMEESLFIDYVDTEWCLRAKHLGILILVAPQLVMEHEIGSNNLKFLKWRVPVHSSARRYYRIRNSFILTNYSYIPKLTSFREVVFSIVHQVFLIAFTDEKKGHLKSLIRGVRDGISYSRAKRRNSSSPM